MSGTTSLIPLKTPFSYDVGIDYDTNPSGRTGFNVTADLNQITQYFHLIRTYQETASALSTTPAIAPNMAQVISYIVNDPGIQLAMGTWNSVVAVPASNGYTAGLMDDPNYANAWVAMVIKAFGGPAAAAQGLKAILLGNELDNGDFVPSPGDPNYDNYINVWIPDAIANLKTALAAQGLGSIPVSASLAGSGNQAFAPIVADFVKAWSPSWNGGVPWLDFDTYPPLSESPNVSTSVGGIISYLQGLANQYNGTPEVFVGETGYSSAWSFPSGSGGTASEGAFYQNLFNGFLSPQQSAGGLTTPVFLFQAFDDPLKPGPTYEQDFGIFSQNARFAPTGLKPGISIPAWTTVSANPAVVTTRNATVAENQSVAASSLFSTTDPVGNPILEYMFWDNPSDGGHFTINGVPQPARTANIVAASNLSQVDYVGGTQAGTEQLLVAAFDGTGWSSWVPLAAATTAPAANQLPVVTTQNVSVAANQAVAASALFSATDPEGAAITQYMFWDNQADGGHFTVNGVTQPARQANIVAASNLSQVNYVGGTQAGTEQLVIAAFDGAAWSNWVPLVATTTGNQLPVVTTHNVTVATNQAVPASSLFSAADPDGNAITAYMFWDNPGDGGHFTVNGVVQPARTANIVAAGNLSQVSYVGGTNAGAEQLVVAAFDGTAWSSWVPLTATTTGAPANQSPVVTTHNVTVTVAQSVAASSLFSATDPNGDAITQYMFWDNQTDGGHFTVNGLPQPARTANIVAASNLNQVNYVGGTNAGTEQLVIAAFDGTTWSSWVPLTATTTTPGGANALEVSDVQVGPSSLTSAVLGSAGMTFIDATTPAGPLIATAAPDEFVLTSSTPGLHEIAGFDVAQDVLELSKARFSSFADVLAHSTPSGGGTLITLDGSSQLLLDGLAPSSLQPGNIVLR